jgi:hypothetical protein
MSAAGLLAMAVVVAACGGGGSKAATSATTSTTTARGGRTAAFNSCMKSHGVATSGLRGFRGGATPTSLPAGVTSQQFQAAFSACRSQLPTGGFGFANNPAFAAYTNCL